MIDTDIYKFPKGDVFSIFQDRFQVLSIHKEASYYKFPKKVENKIIHLVSDMNFDFFKKKIQKLAAEFEKCHLVYLQTEESPQKLEQRRKLEGMYKM